MSWHGQAHQRKVSSFASQICDMANAHGDATRSVVKQSRLVRMLKAHISFLIDELHSLKQKWSIGYDTEIVFCKAADSKGGIESLVDSLSWDTFILCASLRHIVYLSFLKVSMFLTKTVNREAVELQYGGDSVLVLATAGVQKS